MTDKGVVFGNIINMNNNDSFLVYGYIPICSIKSINGGTKRNIQRIKA